MTRSIGVVLRKLACRLPILVKSSWSVSTSRYRRCQNCTAGLEGDKMYKESEQVFVPEDESLPVFFYQLGSSSNKDVEGA